jgi:hypothetical protein
VVERAEHIDPRSLGESEGTVEARTGTAGQALVRSNTGNVAAGQ